MWVLATPSIAKLIISGTARERPRAIIKKVSSSMNSHPFQDILSRPQAWTRLQMKAIFFNICFCLGVSIIVNVRNKILFNCL